MSIQSSLLSAFLVCCLAGRAQNPTLDKQNKLLDEAQRKLDSVMKNNPMVKKYLDKNNQNNTTPNIPNIPSNISPTTLFGKKPDTAFLSKIGLPDRNAIALASIPAKPMTKIELTRFIGDMKHRIMAAMGAATGNKPLVVSTYDADALGNAAVVCWYSGSTDPALELALDAAEKDPDNLNALNNLSGILNMSGFPYKAVPILDYISQQEPDNSTVNNNLGQAYIQLGDVQKAESFLKKAVAGSPYHPHANFSLACIEYTRGNKGAAQSYCENCLRGGFIGNAWAMLKAINPKARLMEYIRERYKQPDDFNPHKYPLPEQCEKADDAPGLKMVYKQYKEVLIAAKKKYEQLYKAEADYVKKNLVDEMMKSISQKKLPLRPFGDFALTLLGDIGETYSETLSRLNRYDSVYFERVKSLKDQYTLEKKKVDDSFKDRFDKAGEGNPDMGLEEDMCKAENEVANKYLPELASLTHDRQMEWRNQTVNYYNDYSYWCYLASIDDHQYHQMFYQLVSQYLTMLEKLAVTEFLGCDRTNFNNSGEGRELKFEEGKCPLKATIEVETKSEETGEKEKPAKFEIDCEEFAAEFEMEDGVAFHLKTTPSGATTIAFTGGLSTKDIKKSKIAKILPVGGSMEFYLTFGGGQPADVGIKWDYNMNLPGALGGKNSAGWSVSMNSGVEFRGDGKLVNAGSAWASKNIFGLDPPAPQQNSNIRMYNNHN